MGERLRIVEAQRDEARARVAELERQRDAVLALCRQIDDKARAEMDWDDPLEAYIAVKEIRAIYGGGE